MSTTTALPEPSSRTVRAEPSPFLRSRRTNNAFAGLSKNTTTGRRVADLLRSFLRSMGDPTDAVLQANALRAAELTVAAEVARAALLAGTGDADKVVRLEGMAARAVKALGAVQAKPAPPSLMEYLAAKRKAEPEDAA